eukprot:TRINITY_DN4486_c0_g1_i1.p1 TRINITY_DN4486_c0_g1~~TRINITY_DN4486_c0_g1_i1.p1  ORF type:complete len:263 (-),score=54.37 TRINITY_DN4486_c0_g1_i1:95-883(-)
MSVDVSKNSTLSVDGLLLAPVSERGRVFRFQLPSHLVGEVELCIFEGDPARLPGSDSGGILWESAEVLAKFLFARGAADILLSGGKAVELGCGCGLGALALGALGVETVACDGQPRVAYGVTAANIMANARHLQAPVHARSLRWSDEADEGALREGLLGALGGDAPALAIGSDLLYDEASNLQLAAMLRRLATLRPPGDFLAILAWQVRHAGKEEAFFRGLEDTFIGRVVEEEAAMDLFADAGFSPVRVVELRSFDHVESTS